MYKITNFHVTLFSHLERMGAGSQLSLKIKVEKTIWNYDLIPNIHLYSTQQTQVVKWVLQMLPPVKDALDHLVEWRNNNVVTCRTIVVGTLQLVVYHGALGRVREPFFLPGKKRPCPTFSSVWTVQLSVQQNATIAIKSVYKTWKWIRRVSSTAGQGHLRKSLVYCPYMDGAISKV